MDSKGGRTQSHAVQSWVGEHRGCTVRLVQGLSPIVSVAHETRLIVELPQWSKLFFPCLYIRPSTKEVHPRIVYGCTCRLVVFTCFVFGKLWKIKSRLMDCQLQPPTANQGQLLKRALLGNMVDVGRNRGMRFTAPFLAPLSST